MDITSRQQREQAHRIISQYDSLQQARKMLSTEGAEIFVRQYPEETLLPPELRLNILGSVNAMMQRLEKEAASL